MNKNKFDNQQDDMIENMRKTIKEAQNKDLYPSSFDLPIGVQYELTSNCNMKCIHCYNKSGKEVNEKFMGTSDWIKLTKELISHGGVFQCIISGGEPLLLEDDLLKIMDLFHDDGTVFTLITNGYLLNKKWIKEFSRYRFNRFQISIDSSKKEEHDKFRQKNGSWEKAVNAAYLVSNSNLPLVIASSVTPQNLENMESMADLAYRLGASALIFGKIMLSGRAAENEEIILNRDEEEIFFEKVNKLSEKYLNTMKIQYSSDTKKQLEKIKSSPMDGVIVRPNGDIRLDCSLPFVIGNVFEDSFVDIWDEKASESLNHPKVDEYIESFDENFSGDKLINYMDKDVFI